MAGEEISVKMGQKDVLDVTTVLGCVLQILVNITLRINHDGRTRSCIGDEIGGMRETAKVILLQHHGVCLFWLLMAISPPRHPYRLSARMGSTRVIMLGIGDSLRRGGEALPCSALLCGPTPAHT